MAIVTEEGLVQLTPPDGFVLITREPTECKCGRMAMFFRNHDGRTWCVACDPGKAPPAPKGEG